jgi:hypothetical protein
MNSARLVSTAAIFGLIAFGVFCVVSLAAWHFFPYPSAADQLLRTRIWLFHVVGEKLGSLTLTCVVAFLAARAYRPSWKIGFFTGVLAAVAFQFFSIVLYLVRFGLSLAKKANKDEVKAKLAAASGGSAPSR